ncbi:hypothetical protein AN901_204183 [Pseudomonas syringae pv. theae]|nr:hypothetical protein AN901_204183 [Pseudomonas syringae pv. theae]
MQYHAQCSSLYISLFLILAEGRGSELVRERASVVAKNTSIEKPFSRTTSLNETPAPRA